MRLPTLRVATVLLSALTACSDDPATSEVPVDTGADGTSEGADGNGGDTPADADPPGDADLATEDGADGAPDVNIEGGEALVSWNAPTTRTDGSGLAEDALGGFRVHYGMASGQYDRAIDVGRATSARIGALEEGRRYYFAVTAYDTAGRESDHSAEAFKDL